MAQHGANLSTKFGKVVVELWRTRGCPSHKQKRTNKSHSNNILLSSPCMHVIVHKGRLEVGGNGSSSKTPYGTLKSQY